MLKSSRHLRLDAISILLCLIAASGCTAPDGTAPSGTRLPSMNEYSKRVKFKEGQELPFPDFTLRYTGQTKVIPRQYPRGFIYYNFVVEASKHTQEVRWSSGTGLIAPLDFSAAGKPFSLELQFSDKLGKLAPDEMVISPRGTP